MAQMSDGGGGGSKKKKPPSSLTKGGSLTKGSGPRPRNLGTPVNYSGGSIGSNSTGRYGAVPSPPSTPAGGGPVPDINSYLGGDSSYQQTLRQLAKAFSDFGADAGRRKGVLTSEYGVSKKALGDQRLMDLDSLEDDYGSRGLLRSGLYGQAVGDYEKEFGNRMSDLERRQQQALQQLLQEQSAFGQQNELQKQAAREDAIRRRAQQLGV
jgi:hypothetical protein